MKFFGWFSTKADKTAVATPAKAPADKAGVLDLTTKAGYGQDDDGERPPSMESLIALSVQRSIGDFPTATFNEIVGDAEFGKTAVAKTKVGDAFSGTQELSLGSISPALTSWYASQGFIGHQLCAIIAQHWLVGKACAMPAEDALRNGWTTDFKGVTESNKVEELTDKLRLLDTKYKVDGVLLEAAKFANVFGIRILIPLVDSTDKEYYRKKFNPDGITPGSFQGWVQIDPQWIFPLLDSVGASDPSSPGFYEPTYWVAGGVTYHKSHLVILKTEEPADVLKPTYMFSGIPLTQRIAERVYAAERTANEAPLLAMSKRTTVLKVDLAKAKMKLAGFMSRLREWINYRDNYQVKVIGKDEEMNESDTSLADLDVVIMTQYQIVAAIARVPATKLLGTSPKGFNATGDHEIKSYHEYLESIQSTWFDRFLERHYLILSRSYLDGVEVTHTWEPVDTVGAEALANIQKLKADTGAVYIDKGVISPDEERSRLRTDKESGYTLPEDVEAPGIDAPPVPGTEVPGAEAVPGAAEPVTDEATTPESVADDVVVAALLATALAPEVEKPGISTEVVNTALSKLAVALQKTEVKPKVTVVSEVKPTTLSVKPSVIPVPPERLQKTKQTADATDEWITTEGGHRVKLGEGGEVKAGFGGKFDGKNINSVTSAKPVVLQELTSGLNRDNMWDTDESEAEVKQRIKAWKDAPADAVAPANPTASKDAAELGLPTTYSGVQAKPTTVALGEVVDNPFMTDTSIKGIDENSITFGQSSTQTVPLNNLVVIQDALDPSTVKARLSDKNFDGIKVGEVDGKLVVLDGNHRLAAASLNGEKDVVVTNVGKVVAKYE